MKSTKIIFILLISTLLVDNIYCRSYENDEEIFDMDYYDDEFEPEEYDDYDEEFDQEDIENGNYCNSYINSNCEVNDDSAYCLQLFADCLFENGEYNAGKNKASKIYDAATNKATLPGGKIVTLPVPKQVTNSLKENFIGKTPAPKQPPKVEQKAKQNAAVKEKNTDCTTPNAIVNRKICVKK
jgi:hypothetical protein